MKMFAKIYVSVSLTYFTAIAFPIARLLIIASFICALSHTLKSYRVRRGTLPIIIQHNLDMKLGE